MSTSRLILSFFGTCLCTLSILKFKPYLSKLLIRRIDDIEIILANGYNILFTDNAERQQVILSSIAIIVTIIISLSILLYIYSLLQENLESITVIKPMLMVIMLLCIVNILFSIYMIMFLILLALVGVLILVAISLIGLIGNRTVHVRGHYRNGSYVRSHYRSRPRRF